jgi:hypothetical protein
MDRSAVKIRVKLDLRHGSARKISRNNDSIKEDDRDMYFHNSAFVAPENMARY